MKSNIRIYSIYIYFFSINFALCTALTLNKGENKQYEIILDHLNILLISTLHL